MCTLSVHWVWWTNSKQINGCSTITSVINSFIHWFSDPFPPNLQNIINHKPEELGSWNFERMFTPHNMSQVTCCMSRVMCHVSHVTCCMSCVTCHVLCVTKCWSLLVEGLLSTGPTPSIFVIHTVLEIYIVYGVSLGFKTFSICVKVHLYKKGYNTIVLISYFLIKSEVF